MKPCNAMLMIPMLFLIACGQDIGAPGGSEQLEERATQAETTPPAMDPARLDHASATAPLLGRAQGGDHLVDAAGLALYYLEANTDGGKCDDACQDVWPPVLTEAAPPAVASDLDQSLVSTVAVGERGVQQVTWDGHPLYRYAGDRRVGDTSGDGVQDAWGSWHLMSGERD